MGTKEWVAVHRKHHAKCETEEDPHSPVMHLDLDTVSSPERRIRKALSGRNPEELGDAMHALVTAIAMSTGAPNWSALFLPDGIGGR